MVSGRGRGVKADREAIVRGCGVSQERGDGPVQGAGRAYHIGSTTGPVGTDTLSSALFSTHLGFEGSIMGGANGSGNGNRNASGLSIGRGATRARGRRDRAQAFFMKTRVCTLRREIIFKKLRWEVINYH